jgi:hypothetical protein
MSRILAIVITLSVVGCDDTSSAPAGDKPAAPAASADAKGGAEKAPAGKPSDKAADASTKADAPKADAPKDEPAADAAADAPAADGEAFGVAACDDYAAKVAACSTFDRKSKIYTMLTEQWRKDIAEGKQADAEAKCTKAAGMFRCPKA